MIAAGGLQGGGKARIRSLGPGSGADKEAANASISRVLSREARRRSRSWFSEVSTGSSMETPIKWSSPAASMRSIEGNFSAARAALMRLTASASEKPRRRVR